MMKGGLFRYVKEALIFLVVCGLILAFLHRFDYDFVAAGSWIINKAWEIIVNIAGMFTKSEQFNKFVS